MNYEIDLLNSDLYSAYRYSFVLNDVEIYEYNSTETLNSCRKLIVLNALKDIEKYVYFSENSNITFEIINLICLNKDLFRIVFNISLTNPYSDEISRYVGNIFISLKYQIILINSPIKITSKIIKLIENYIKNYIKHANPQELNIFSLGINAIVDEDYLMQNLIGIDNVKELSLNLRGPNLGNFRNSVNNDIHRILGSTDTEVTFKNGDFNMKIDSSFCELFKEPLKLIRNGLGNIVVKTRSMLISSNNYPKKKCISNLNNIKEIEKKLKELHNESKGENRACEETT